MKAYSLDLRQRVVVAYEAGQTTVKEVAKRFSVGETFVKKMLRQKRSTGVVPPPARGGGKKRTLEEKHLRVLRRWLKTEPDLTLSELQEKLLGEKKKAVSIAALSASLQREQLWRKKKQLVAQERNNRKRSGYWQRVKGIAAQRLKFVDEAGFNRAMTRLWGRAWRGTRVRESVPRNYGANISALSLISLSKVEATMTIEGSVDAEVFNAFAEQFIRPILKAGDCLVLDNLGAHRASRIEQIAESCGAKVIWLAPYSPDFSPIELMWSKLKTLFRASKARTREEIEAALDKALKQITKSDCQSWFRHCGYEVALIQELL